MKLINRNIGQTASLLLLGALLLCITSGSATYISFRADRTFNQMLAEGMMRRTASDLLSAMQDAETGQRGYIITRDEDFLTPYRRAVTELPGLRKDLHDELTEDGEEVSTLMGRLDTLIDQRMALITQSVDLITDNQADAAYELVNTGEGKVKMDEIRSILGTLLAGSDQRISRMVAVQQRLNMLGKLVSIVGGLAMLVVVGSAFVVLVRQLRALRRAEMMMRELNVHLEERVAQRTEDLIRANQEVQRFAYIVTHDLRAPLVNIMGFTSELESALKPLQAYVLADGAPVSPLDIQDARTAAAEDLPEAVAFIRSSTRKMDGLINAILKISRDGRREIRPETIRLQELAEQATNAVAHQIMENGGSVAIDIQIPEIVSDRLSLEQAVGNIIDNAVKYQSPDRPLALKIRARREGRAMLRLEIEDNGRGIAASDHERVFELFRRSGTQDRPGEGIGLAHVRSLVRNLGGEITLTSVHGQGSTFILHVPTDLRKVLETVQT